MIYPHDDPAYNRRMTKAASSLVIQLPFFGYLLFGSGVRVVAGSIATMATDGVRIICGQQFVLQEDINIVVFGLLHELLHIYFSHHGRRGNRDTRIWNIAADIYTNGVCSELLGNGSTRWPVPDRFIQPQTWAEGKTVEEIYEILDKQQKADPKALEQYQSESPGEIGDGHDMVEPEKLPPDAEDAQDDSNWQSTFREDISRAKAMAERSPLHRELPSAVVSRMDKIMKASLPWGSLLRGGVADSLGWDEATYCPPKLKYYPIIVPQTRSLKERILLLGIDVSASVTQELIRIFQSNVQSAAARATKVVIVTFDAVVREHYTTTQPRNIFSHVKFKSGAHSSTSAMGLFEIADKVKPSGICIMTDGYIKYPDSPYRNTIWVIPEGGARPSWGRTYVMEHHWR